MAQSNLKPKQRRTRVRASLIGLILLSVAPLSAPAASDPIPLKKGVIRKVLQHDFCTHLFAKEWKTAELEFLDSVPKNGFKYGAGTQMKVTVDGTKRAEGTFLGRMTDVLGTTTHYMFEDYADKRYYMIDAKRIEFAKTFPKNEMQTFYQTVEQYENTCVVASIKNHFLDKLASGHEGNGLLRGDIEAGRLDKLGDIGFDYYIANRGGGNFGPMLKVLGKKYGYLCKSIELGASEAHFADTIFKLLGKGFPVILEFYIGMNMVTAESQWIDTKKNVGEDRRFWAPREIGQQKGGGHAIVAVETFDNGAGNRKLIIKDGDWDSRSVIWDYDEYFAKRIKSSGMIGHFCEDLPKK